MIKINLNKDKLISAGLNKALRYSIKWVRENVLKNKWQKTREKAKYLEDKLEKMHDEKIKRWENERKHRQS